MTSEENGQETFRGAVYTWECDAVEHFTTACYFRKLSGATQRLARQLGAAGAQAWTKTCRARFYHELRVGDVYHVRSGVVDDRGDEIVLGHRFYNSETDEVCTAFQQTLAGAGGGGGALPGMHWDDKEAPRKVEPERASNWIASSATIVRADEVDWSGRYDLGSLINQLSAANIQSQASFGLTPSYMRQNRRGYSTAEYQLETPGPLPGVGAELESRSAVVHVGSSSVWFMHDLFDAGSNKRVARLAQLGVLLDLDKRRPCPIPDELRERLTRGLRP